MRIPCERQKQDAPGVGDPRAFALPREIGVTDLRKGISRLSADDCQVEPFAAHEQACIAAILRRAWCAHLGYAERHENSFIWWSPKGEGCGRYTY